MEDFYLDIPGVDPKDIEKAKEVAQKDIDNDTRRATRNTRQSTSKSSTDDKSNGDMGKEIPKV